MPRKAMLLAAGFGSRLQPLTAAMPKPLMPLWGRPLLDRVIDLLVRQGVTEVVVNAHWHGEMLKKHIDGSDYGVTIHFSRETEIRGTGGALLPWRDFFSDGPFWVINGDIAASLSLQGIVAAYASLPGLAGACWVTAERGPRTVEMDHAGRITCFRSPDPGIDGTFTFCGAQLLSPAILGYIREQPFSTLVEAYEKAMQNGLFLKGAVLPESYWNDAGTLDRYREIHGETKKLALSGKPGGELYSADLDLQRDSRRFFGCIAPTAMVPPEAEVRDSIVFDGVVLGQNAVLRNAIIQGGSLDGRVENLCCVSGGQIDDPRIRDAVNAVNWDMRQCAFEFIGRRGSCRSFWRVYHQERRAIVIVDDGGRSENLRYADHTRLLRRAGVPVPGLLYVSGDALTVIMEDLGGVSLTDKMAAKPETAERLYSRIISAVACFHREVTRIAGEEKHALEPAFDTAMYRWEHDLFETHILRERFGFEAMPPQLRAELDGAVRDLVAGSRVIVHRDLQSSNILFSGRRFVFIDYQGMRWGSPAYDIASLLYDPYVRIDSTLRCRLAAEYAGRLPECPDVVQLFFKGAVQRLVQALGAFGRLAGLGHASFTRHILPGLENLLEAADAADCNALGGVVEELIVREQMRRCE